MGALLHQTGQKDRTVPRPARALLEIREQMDFVRRLHAQDLAAGYADTFLPRQLEKKYKNAAKELIWQWFFPAPTLTFIQGENAEGGKQNAEGHQVPVGATLRPSGSQPVGTLKPPCIGSPGLFTD